MATNCNILQHAATHCNIDDLTQYLCCVLPQHTATLCNVLQRTAAHCSTLQHTATHCNTLQRTATYCSTRQHAAAHCNTLQHRSSCTVSLLCLAPTCCNTLQHKCSCTVSLLCPAQPLRRIWCLLLRFRAVNQLNCFENAHVLFPFFKRRRPSLIKQDR